MCRGCSVCCRSCIDILVVTGSGTDVGAPHAMDRVDRVDAASDVLCSVSGEARHSLPALYGNRFSRQIEAAGSEEILAAWD